MQNKQTLAAFHGNTSMSFTSVRISHHNYKEGDFNIKFQDIRDTLPL